MSSLLGLTPVVRLKLENVFLEKSYPGSGSMEGTIDTGYQGFVAVPRNVFDALGLGELRTVRRVVELSDGRKLESLVASATAEVVGTGAQVDGPVEMVPGLSEVLVGTKFLSRFKLTLDYCLRISSLERCH